MLPIEFEANVADPAVARLIEKHVRKATQALRCPHHFPRSVSFQVDEVHVSVVDACCPLFLRAVRDSVGNVLA
jgi:hypothetical protein